MSEAKHTPGPWVVRQINATDKPYALIDPRGPHGDIIIAGYVATEAQARLLATATILPDLYASEINATLTWFWDGGFDVSLGDEMNGVRAEGSCKHYVDALEWLRDKAVEHWPVSEFAKRYAIAKATA